MDAKKHPLKQYKNLAVPERLLVQSAAHLVVVNGFEPDSFVR
jgi:hypothetical protein